MTDVERVEQWKRISAEWFGRTLLCVALLSISIGANVILLVIRYFERKCGL